MKIGFIGLGIMGKPMAKNLLKAGYTDLLVNNRSQAPVQELEAAGAKGATQQEIGEQCDVVITILFVHRLIGVDRKLLVVFFTLFGRTHKLIVHLDRDVRAGHFSGLDFRIDEVLGIGMLDRKRQHQRAAPPILRHLAGRIRIAFHKGHDTGRGEGTVEHRTARRPNMRKVVSYAPAPLHQLHLLFVDADDTAVRVGRILVADHKTVRQRCSNVRS